MRWMVDKTEFLGAGGQKEDARRSRVRRKSLWRDNLAEWADVSCPLFYKSYILSLPLRRRKRRETQTV